MGLAGDRQEDGVEDDHLVFVGLVEQVMEAERVEWFVNGEL